MQKTLGQTLTAIRTKNNWSQTEIAKKSNIGSSYLSAIEKDKKKPTIETLYTILIALECDNVVGLVIGEIENRLGIDG